VPGGGADVTSRVIALKLHDPLGQQVVVDNRGGWQHQSRVKFTQLFATEKLR
jgi:hypothetical protein